MIDISKEKCSGCCACHNICPASAITMQFDAEGFAYPVVDKAKCKNCGLCLKACPVITQRAPQTGHEVSAYAAYCKNAGIRRESSSGGMFSVLAEYILAEGGVVYGAAFAKDWSVAHKRISKISELGALRGSKYVQSYIGTSFQSCLSDLQEGRLVLFSGTPCQIAGLKAFLRQDFDNLLTVDIICHGVPSPLVWKRYLAEKYDVEKINAISFRSKSAGWKRYRFAVKENGVMHEKEISKENFMLGFLNNLYLRKSCYNCSFKSASRCSDLTIADFWGVDSILPAMDDDLGTSLVLLQSSKGRKILESIKDKLVLQEAALALALQNNSSAVMSVKLNKNRQKFFSAMLLQKDSVDDLIDKYAVYRSPRKRLKLYLKKMISKYLKL